MINFIQRFNQNSTWLQETSVTALKYAHVHIHTHSAHTHPPQASVTSHMHTVEGPTQKILDLRLISLVKTPVYVWVSPFAVHLKLSQHC